MFNKFKSLPWTPRAYTLWADIKFTIGALIVAGLVVFIDWIQG